MVSGLRLCFPVSFGSESRVGAAQHGRKGGTPRCVTRSFTILVTIASFITDIDVMTSGPRPVRISSPRSPTGFLLRTHTTLVEQHKSSRPASAHRIRLTRFLGISHLAEPSLHLSA